MATMLCAIRAGFVDETDGSHRRRDASTGRPRAGSCCAIRPAPPPPGIRTRLSTTDRNPRDSQRRRPRRAVSAIGWTAATPCPRARAADPLPTAAGRTRTHPATSGRHAHRLSVSLPSQNSSAIEATAAASRPHTRPPAQSPGAARSSACTEDGGLSVPPAQACEDPGSRDLRSAPRCGTNDRESPGRGPARDPDRAP